VTEVSIYIRCERAWQRFRVDGGHSIVRVLPVTLALSAALHGAAIAWVTTHAEDREDLAAVSADPGELLPAVTVEPEPLIVALLDDSRPSSSTRPSSSRTATTLRQELARGGRSAPGPAAVETNLAPQAPEPATTSKPGHDLMTMRRPELETRPSTGFVERFLDSSRPLPPKDLPGEQLAADIAASRGRLGDPRWVANASPDQVTGERAKLVALRHEQATRELVPDGAGAKAEHMTFSVRVAPDGSARIEDKPNIQPEGLGVRFDITDAMMRRRGMDPYASYKLKVLDQTRDERVAMGKRHRSRELARSHEYVQAHLARLWASAQGLAARKQGLFELWDDCAESGSEELVAGGQAARAYVVGFIRSKLPAGSAIAFTAGELAQLNRQRRSREVFAPYP
jgi:hypothetical protein